MNDILYNIFLKYKSLINNNNYLTKECFGLSNPYLFINNKDKSIKNNKNNNINNYLSKDCLGLCNPNLFKR